MDLVAPHTTFSIPFRRPNSAFGSLPAFVGDQANLVLKYLLKPGDIRDSDWPLILVGPPGTGKTELAHSVIIGAAEFGKKPVLTSATEFSRSFRSAIETDSVREFRSKYTKSGGVVLDQIDDLVRFPKSQLELVFLIDRLVQRNVPLVATCGNSFGNSEQILPQLASRLSAGLSLPVYPPGKLARQQIIQQLAQIHSIQLGPAEIDFLVQRLSVTVPRIGLFFNQWVSSIDRSDSVSVKQLETYFEQTMLADSDRLMKLIVEAVAKQFQLSASDITSSSRKQTTSLARSIVVYFSRKMLGISFSRIGGYLGNRDHSTIMHAFNKANRVVDQAGTDDVNLTRIAHLELQLNELMAANV